MNENLLNLNTYEIHALIDGLHKIIIKAGDSRRVSPDEVAADFSKLKAEIFGAPTDD